MDLHDHNLALSGQAAGLPLPQQGQTPWIPSGECRGIHRFLAIDLIAKEPSPAGSDHRLRHELAGIST